MGSLRNPIGPLPSSIYWRRRAVAVAVLALLVLLVVWLVNLAGSGGTGDQGKGGGQGPASTITPGPSESGPAISDRPGGREEEGDTGGSGDAPAPGSGGGSGEGGGTGGPAGGPSGWDLEADDTPAEGGSGGGGSSGGGSAGAPAAAKLPDCGESDVQLTLRTEKKAYAPGEKPEFELTAVNEGDGACAVDLGAKHTTVTVTDGADEDFWTSGDCIRDVEAAVLKVPADGETSRTFTWNREPSTPGCGTPPTGKAPAGSYGIEVDIDGLKKVYALFDLKKG